MVRLGDRRADCRRARWRGLVCAARRGGDASADASAVGDTLDPSARHGDDPDPGPLRLRVARPVAAGSGFERYPNAAA